MVARRVQTVDGTEFKPEEILEQLRARNRVLRWQPLPADMGRTSTENEQARNRGSLDYLHRNWVLPHKFDPVVAGGGFRGRLIALFGRLSYRVLSPYLQQERELLGHLVRISETLERRCDELTLRGQQLQQDFLDRQVAEARNLTELALWLYVESPDNRAEPNGSDTDSRVSDTPSP